MIRLIALAMKAFGQIPEVHRGALAQFQNGPEVPQQRNKARLEKALGWLEKEQGGGHGRGQPGNEDPGNEDGQDEDHGEDQIEDLDTVVRQLTDRLKEREKNAGAGQVGEEAAPIDLTDAVQCLGARHTALSDRNKDTKKALLKCYLAVARVCLRLSPTQWKNEVGAVLDDPCGKNARSLSSCVGWPAVNWSAFKSMNAAGNLLPGFRRLRFLWIQHLIGVC